MAIELKNLIIGLRNGGYTNAAHRLELTGKYLAKENLLPPSLGISLSVPQKKPGVETRDIKNYLYAPIEPNRTNSLAYEAQKKLIYLKLAFGLVTFIPGIVAARQAAVYSNNGDLAGSVLLTSAFILTSFVASRLIRSAQDDGRRITSLNTQ